MRTKFKATAVAVIAAFAMLVGGLTAAAPAQAVVGSSVAYVACSGTGCGKDLRVSYTSGGQFNMPMGNQANNVFQVRPWGVGQRLHVKFGTVERTLGCGAAFAPANSGIYRITQRSC